MTAPCGNRDGALPEKLEGDLAALAPALVTSQAWMVSCHSLIEGLSFDTALSHRVAISLQHLCIEHQAGVHVLASEGVFGSAFALFRSQLEAFIRGSWMHRCASHAEVERFMAGNDPPTPSAMIQALEQHEAFANGGLSRMKRDIWDNLCSFTHGGSIQVLARNAPGRIEQRYRVEHVVGLISASVTLGLLAAVGIAAAMEDDQLAIDLREAYRAATCK